MAAVAASAFVLASCGSGTAEASRAKKSGPPVVSVVAAEARRMPAPLELHAIGNVEALSAVAVRPRIAGQIQKVHFQEGSDVRTGQLLFTIDPREPQQAVREAEAAVAAQRAAVGQAEANYQRDLANAANARSQAERYAGLAAKGIVSRQENEQLATTATAAERGAAASRALIDSARAALQGAEAKLADARLQLGYTTVRAPIAGRTGTLAYKLGDLVTANADPPMITINQVSPVYVTFSVPEQELATLRRYAARGKLRVIATPQNEQQQAEGVLDFFDNRVDEGTGTILLKARFSNQDRRLWPGQFADVSVHLATPEELVVPSAALRNAQTGNYVFVVRPDMTAEQRKVTSPRSFGEFAVIAQGLRPGEKVITEGQLRVRANSKVQIRQAGNQAAAE